MAIQMEDMPKEILCKFLELLDTDEKFKVRAVCKRWRNQIDENVSFHAIITNRNYNLIQQRFGTCRKVKSIWIYEYQSHDIPIHSLNFLKCLTIRDEVNNLAVADILSRAVNLNVLELSVNHSKESAKIQQATGIANYPALRHIKHVCVRYNSSYNACWSGRAWNQFLYGEMPNVQRLVVQLYPNIPPPRGFDFFRLAAGMPNLQEFTLQIWTRIEERIRREFSVAGEVQPLTPEISRGLVNLKLTKVVASVFEKDEEVWKALLAAQCQMKKLILSNEIFATRGFHISMIRPVLHKSRESLDTVVLDIDTSRNEDVDVEIFSSLKSLRILVLKAWPKKDGRFGLPKITGCSTVVSETLEKLSIIGFKFTEQEAINVIKNMPSNQLDRIQIGSKFASVWRNFETRLEEMGIVRYGHSSKCPSQYRSRSPNVTKVYIGATLELQHDYEFSGFLKSDCSRKVKEITIEGQSLTMESRYMWSYT